MSLRFPDWRIFRIQKDGAHGQFHVFAAKKDLRGPEQLIARTTSIESARATIPGDAKQVYSTQESEQWIR